MTSGNGVMEKLIDYVSNARTTALPPEVLTKTKHHILDTLAAMISGSLISPRLGTFTLTKMISSGPDFHAWLSFLPRSAVQRASARRA